MKNSVIILNESKGYRIIEVLDIDYEIEYLKGDCFNPELNSGLTLTQLRAEELKFESKVENDGVYGYVLERWNPNIGCGWETVDSCWGFIGRHASEDHYIVNEFITQAEEN